MDGKFFDTPVSGGFQPMVELGLAYARKQPETHIARSRNRSPSPVRYLSE